MITGMLLFYMGGLLLYPQGHLTYGILCLGVGIVMFGISVEKIICYMSIMKKPQDFKDELQMQKERSTSGHRRVTLERNQKISFVGFGIVLLGLAFLKVKLVWIFVVCILFLLIYLWLAYLVYQMNRRSPEISVD